jgi:hypothetical protein
MCKFIGTKNIDKHTPVGKIKSNFLNRNNTATSNMQGNMITWSVDQFVGGHIRGVHFPPALESNFCYIVGSNNRI